MSALGGLVYLDIETTSLRADAGIIVAAAVSNDEVKVKFAPDPDAERELLVWLEEELKDVSTIATWNGSDFDIPFIVTRALIHGLDFSWLRKKNVLDLYAWCKKALLLSNYKLDYVAYVLGVSQEQGIRSVEVDVLYWRAVRGDEEAKQAIISHCRSDVIKLKRIHDKIKYLVAARAGRKRRE